MKWQIVLTVAAVALIVVAANLVKSEREEAKVKEAFARSVRAGDEAYGRACGACHGRYDPRFLVYEEWAKILDGPGCPRVTVKLTPEERNGIRDFLRAGAAPTEEEAETVRERERSRTRSEGVARGGEVFRKACGECHGHPYFPKIQTAAGWVEALKELGSLHRDAGKPVWVDGKQGADLAAFLAAGAAGTPSDARAIRALLASGSAPVETPAGTEPAELHWVRDHAEGIKTAAERKLPVIVDLTDLGGT